MAVYVPIPDEIAGGAPELPSKTYALDLDAGRIIGYVDQMEAIQQAIRKALITPRFHCLIYGTDYGSEIKDRISDDAISEAYINADLESVIEDCLMVDDRILGINDLTYSSSGDEFHISFTVSTIFGQTKVEETFNV